MNRRSLILAALAAWLAGAGLLIPAHGLLLNWDEVGYVDAARRGFWVNVTDSGSLWPGEFFDFGLAKWTGRTPHLPAGYEEEQDLLFQRSYHPPYVVVPLMFAASSSSDRLLRLPLLFGGLALSALLFWAYALYRRMDPQVPASAGGLAAMVILAAWSVRLVFSSMHGHGWMCLFTLLTACALVLWLEAPSRARGLFVCVALAMAMVTLQSAPPVWAAAGVVVLAWRRGWRTLAAGAAVAVTLTVLLWPGFVLHVSLVKMWAYYLYIARLGQEHAERWRRLPNTLRGLLPLAAAAPCAVAILARRWPARLWVPPLLVAVAYAAPVSAFAIVPQYPMPALVVLTPLVGCALDAARSWVRWAGCGALLAFAAFAVAATPFPGDSDRRADLEWLRGALAGRSALADGAHIYRHYLGQAYEIAPVTVSWDGTQLLLREEGTYREAGLDDLRGKLVVIRRYRKHGYAEDVTAPPLASCRRTERPATLLFDCSVAPP